MNPINSNSIPLNNIPPTKAQSPAREAFALQMARALGTSAQASIAPEIGSPKIEPKKESIPLEKQAAIKQNQDNPRLGLVLDIRV